MISPKISEIFLVISVLSFHAQISDSAAKVFPTSIVFLTHLRSRLEFFSSYRIFLC